MSKARCLHCEDVIESKHRHDFVKCKCGKSFLDGGDDYFRGGGSLGLISDEEFCLAVDRDQALQKLIKETVEDNIFNDDSFLDDDFDDYNLGYQAGTLDERDRIIKLLEPLGCKANGVEHDCQDGLGYTTAADLIKLIKGEQK
jgi:hypothetical protein